MGVTKVSASFYRERRKLIVGIVLAALTFTASAAVYYSLDHRIVVTSATPKVIFFAAADSTAAGATIGTNSTYAKLTGLKVYPNATTTYEQALNISNTDSGAHNARFRSISITGGSSAYGTNGILVKLTDATATVQSTLTYNGGGSWTTVGSSTAFVSPRRGAKWSIRLDMDTNAPIAGGITTTIELIVDVS